MVAAVTTERRSGKARRPLGIGPIAAAATAAFVLVFALLAVQMRSGADPLLSKAPPPKRILIRKVIQRVEQVVVVPSAAPSPPPQTSSTSSSSAAPAPVLTRSS